ncbi:glycosyltransferase family 4 protein [Lichenifustis flavocetrariae]|uniref:Glycosyltransferase family 4 protein n=1 Tax=Lichenifustis flavocetrariae TaxID=2949735 RepID=A0AA41Z0A0_9HYPH|nr:glycosyltransferase family 4 protein [Lichenifustis flavocetrariae]MCW6510586.1 glycosyltransferase family 4 protein [Lichenifustis flavocetrariae]
MIAPVVFLLKGYPRLSETFIAEEIAGLEAAGMPIRIVSMRQPTDKKIHPVHRRIKAPVSYLPEYLHREPLRVLRCVWSLRRAPGVALVFQAFVADLRRDFTRNRVRRFGQAFVLAAELPEGTAHVHAHFIHTPASVARYAAGLLRIAWSCSAHAKDIWTSPAWDLRQKLAEATFTVTCTAAGRSRLQSLTSEARQVSLVYHGLRLDRFVRLALPESRRDGRDPDMPVRLLSVGRAVEKKGFDLLLEALARIPADQAWSWIHIGGGALLPGLKMQAKRLGLEPRLTWCGSQDQDAVLDAYRAADLFVLPCRVASDGDRDGLPNVLVEAQSQGLACVSTRVAGVTELIDDGHNGILVPPDDPAALAAALTALIADPSARHRLGRAGALRVEASFDATRATAALMTLFADHAGARHA